MRKTSATRSARGFASFGLAATSLVALGISAASATEVGKLVRVTTGDPFAGCTADKVGKQIGTNYPATEIEPWVAADPTDPNRLLTGYQQDRWSNGGSRGLVGSVSTNGGASWKRVIPGKVTECEGGPWNRASDPWVDFSTTGIAYFSHLALGPTLKNDTNLNNGQVVTRSLDGGRTWEAPVTIIRDTNKQILDDKNSITADPTRPSYAYVVWDRLRDFTVPPDDGGGEGHGNPDPGAFPGISQATLGDGVALFRTRVKEMRALAAAPQKAPEKVFFIGPTYLSRTTDSGKTWSKPRKIFDPGPNAQTIANQIVVQPNGTVINFFTHFYSNGNTNIELISSHDGGQSFGQRKVVSEIFSVGVTTPDKHEPVRDASDLFDVAVDPKNGNLYAVWQDARFLSAHVDTVAFSMSTDGGKSWSQPAPIAQTPFSDDDPLNQAFIPSIEVAANGTLVVTYYDFRNDRKAGGEATDYWAVFCDPSKSSCANYAQWGGEVRLTDKPFDMLDAPEAGGHFLGDYMGLTHAGNAVVPMFGVADGKNQTSLYTRRITFGGKAEVAAAAQ